MNKNIEVLVAEYDSGVFLNIYEVYNINYAPYILKSFYTEDDFNNNPFRTNLNNWFKARFIMA